MLLAGTGRHLEDLDREYTLVEDAAVTAVTVVPATATARATESLTSGAAGTVYALLDGERVVRVDEHVVVPVGRVDAGRGQSMAAAGAQLVVGVEGAHLLVLDLEQGEATPLASFDEVAGRDGWENPAGRSPDLRSLAVASDGSWFANVHVGGLWRSRDEGRSWAAVIPPDDDVHEVATGSGGRVVVAAARGFGWSMSDGDTWTWSTDGLHAAYARAVALDGDTAYVTASTGPSTTDGRLYRCRLGEPFEQCAGGLPASFPYNLDTGCCTARAGEVALGTRDGYVYRSTDGGAAFERITERLPPVRVLRFV